jgi:site-specific DNA recombinase
MRGVEVGGVSGLWYVRQVNMTISLAFLAPALVQAAVEERLPRGVGVANLRDAPAEWSRQYAMLGLSA